MKTWRWLFPIAVLAFALTVLVRRMGWCGWVRSNIGQSSMPSPGLYDVFAGFLMDSYHDRIAREVLTENPAGKVLDVGCGTGQLAIKLSRIAPGLEVTGLDISPGMINRATKRSAKLDPRIRPSFIVGDVGHLPFPDADFDAVVSSLSLHHWPDSSAGLAEVYRVLKPGGRMFIYDFSDRFLRRFHHFSSPPRLDRIPVTVSTEPFRWPGSLALSVRMRAQKG